MWRHKVAAGTGRDILPLSRQPYFTLTFGIFRPEIRVLFTNGLPAMNRLQRSARPRLSPFSQGSGFLVVQDERDEVA
jgi:hypothetical protein